MALTASQALTLFLTEQQGWSLADTGTINGTTGLSATAVAAFAKWLVARGSTPDTLTW